MGGNGFTRISTRGLAATQRFDFWREVHRLIDVDVPDGASRNGFNADLLFYALSGTLTFGHASNDDTVARFESSGEEFVLLSQTLSGSVEIETRQGGVLAATPSSGLVVADGSRLFRTRSRNHEHVYLTLPRAMLADIPLASRLEKDGLCVLPTEGLAGLLTSHMTELARRHGQLAATAAASAVKAAADMAFTAFELAGSEPARTLSELHDPALKAAAGRLIELHLHEPGLTVARIASALNCSRAHLYRVFSGDVGSIGDLLRTARLRRASVLLVENPTWSIDRIAGACGFANASGFIRSFRRHHGMTPGAFREAALSSLS